MRLQFNRGHNPIKYSTWNLATCLFSSFWSVASLKTISSNQWLIKSWENVINDLTETCVKSHLHLVWQPCHPSALDLGMLAMTVHDDTNLRWQHVGNASMISFIGTIMAKNIAMIMHWWRHYGCVSWLGRHDSWHDHGMITMFSIIHNPFVQVWTEQWRMKSDVEDYDVFNWWQKNVVVCLDDRIDVLHDGSLFIREVTEEDSLKWYKCVGTHSVTQSKVQSQTESIQMGPRGAQIVLQGYLLIDISIFFQFSLCIFFIGKEKLDIPIFH